MPRDAQILGKNLAEFLLLPLRRACIAQPVGVNIPQGQPGAATDNQSECNAAGDKKTISYILVHLG